MLKEFGEGNVDDTYWWRPAQKLTHFDVDNSTIQKLRKDVVKGVIAYVNNKGAMFGGPSPVDYTDPTSKKNIYNGGFPDTNVYVYPKVVESFAYQKNKFASELHLGVAKQFFETFCKRGETVASFYCGGGTGAAAAMLIGMNCVSVDIEETQVLSCNMRITFRESLTSLLHASLRSKLRGRGWSR
jgi:hypothetical protein